MEQNMSRPEAARFEYIPVRVFLDVAVVALLLWGLMADPFRVLSFSWILLMPVAMFLSIMVWEDAFFQTVDLGLLFVLACLMLGLAFFHGHAGVFLRDAVLGVCCFRFLLVSTSFWLTCRSAPVAVPSVAWEGGEDSESRDEHLVGYLPIFMVTYILYMGIGDGFASFVFAQANFVVSAVDDILRFFPVLSYFGIVVWVVIEGAVWWMEHRRGCQIVWAFGGGDILFLGLFAGYIGFASLSALFFLSLFGRIALALVQFFLDSCFAAS